MMLAALEATAGVFKVCDCGPPLKRSLAYVLSFTPLVPMGSLTTELQSRQDSLIFCLI